MAEQKAFLVTSGHLGTAHFWFGACGQAWDVEEGDKYAEQKQGKGAWEEGLASDSESAVKADRAETGQSTKEQISKLQEEAKKVGSK